MTGLIATAYVLLAIATFAASAWCVLYHVITKGGWWSTTRDGANWHGRNFMGLMAVLALMMAFTLCGPLLSRWVLAWVSVVLFAAVIVVIVHRAHLLVQDQRRAHPQVRARDAARDDARDLRRDPPRDAARDLARDDAHDNPR